MENRGQGLSTNAIILIVLGVLVLVVLIVGFTAGWGTLAPWLNNNNVDTVASQCEMACELGSTSDFGFKVRELNDGVNKIETTCAVLSTVTQLKDKYGIKPCPGMEGPKNVNCAAFEIMINGKKQPTTSLSLSNSACSIAFTDIGDLVKDSTNTNHCCIPDTALTLK